uniref:FAS1 domain-containing protein n=1 Tax=Fagus sylvatica TaxID=28930 RepID=A0A2N9GEW5_FAGSY
MAMIFSHNLLLFFFFLTFLFILKPSNTLLADQTPTTHSAQINSNSVLVALLDSHYTELAELVEKALLLQTLEDAVGHHNITIFAPNNEAFDLNLDPEFKRFLLEPRNLKSLRTLLLSHIVPKRIGLHDWPQITTEFSTRHGSLANDRVELTSQSSGEKFVGSSRNRPENKPVEETDTIDQTRFATGSADILRNGAGSVTSTSSGYQDPSWTTPHQDNGIKQVKDFIHTLLQYHRAMAKLSTDQLTLCEQYGVHRNEIAVDYHIIEPGVSSLSEGECIGHQAKLSTDCAKFAKGEGEGGTEKVKYDTLRLPYKVVAQEADGSVKFGQGEGSAYLFDPDIYTDGRISVQGIDGVLFPVQETTESETKTTSHVKVAANAKQPRRVLTAQIS